MNTVIRIYVGMIAAYLEDPTTGQFIGDCLGEFPSVESAALYFRKEGRPIFVEDCIFNTMEIPRYAITWSHGFGTPEYIHLTQTIKLDNSATTEPQEQPTATTKLSLGNSKLGNPLTVIAGYVQLALQPSTPVHELKRYLNEIATAITEAISLTKQHHILCLHTVSYGTRFQLLINYDNTSELFQVLGPFASITERDEKAAEISKLPDVLVFTIDGPASSIEINSKAIPK